MLLVRVPQQSATRSLSGSVVALSSLGYSESTIASIKHLSYSESKMPPKIIKNH